MKVMVAVSSIPGSEELKPIADGEPIPLAKVRLRYAYLTRLIKQLGENVRFHQIQSDMEMAKDILTEIRGLEGLVKLLSRIRTQADRPAYNEYIEYYSDLQ